MSIPKTYGVVLLSGGLDSTVVATIAKTMCAHVTALTVDYGQRCLREMTSARRVAQNLGIKHKYADATVLGKLAQHSALTNQGLPVPKYNPDDIHIPITYVPQRNLFLTALAASTLESTILSYLEPVADDVDGKALEGRIFLGVNAVDYSGYPDCRPEFYTPLQAAIQQGSKAHNKYGVCLEITTPIILMTKPDIIREGLRLGAPLEHTWSCYKGGIVPCGECDSCGIRADAFTKVGISDPALKGS